MLELIQVEIQAMINLLSKEPYPSEGIKQAKFLLIRLKNNLRKIKAPEARQLLLSARQIFSTASNPQMRRDRNMGRDRKVIDMFQRLQLRMDKWLKD